MLTGLATLTLTKLSLLLSRVTFFPVLSGVIGLIPTNSLNPSWSFHLTVLGRVRFFLLRIDLGELTIDGIGVGNLVFLGDAWFSGIL